jgi:hypothetical protein
VGGIPLREELFHPFRTVLGNLNHSALTGSEISLGLIQFGFELVFQRQRVLIQIIQKSAQGIPLSLGELLYLGFDLLKR